MPASPSRISFKVSHKVFSGGFELVPDESQSEHPASEGVGFIFGLLRFGIRSSDLFGKLAHRKTKLDHGFELSCMQATFPSITFLIKIEAAELNRVVAVEKAVEVEHAVACW